jgi:cellulose biosynthesis protein BcsQ
MAAGADAHNTTIVAFYSYAGGAGRSCTVANVALIMASQGYHVLVADLDLASPSLHRFLAAFLPETGMPARSPVRLTCQFAVGGGVVDFLGPATEVVTDPESYDVRREDLVGRGYDYVLIDAPAGATPEVRAVTEQLPDVLVLAYSLNKQAMDGAVKRALDAERSHRGPQIRILPVPMRVDRRARGVTARMRTEGRRQFAWLLAALPEQRRRDYWDNIEIPYEPDYAVEEGLAFLDDPSGQRDRLLEAYQRLAAELAQAEDVPRAGPGIITTRSREQYLASRLAAAGSSTSVVILHTGPDRNWAEWLLAELGRVGMDARRQRIDQIGPLDIDSDASVLLTVSAGLLASPGIGTYLAAIAERAELGGHAPLAVSVDHARLPGGQLPAIGYLDLADRPEEDARRDLATYYNLALESAPGADGIQYPGRIHDKRFWNVPAGVGSFHGRDDLMDLVRDHFTSAEAAQPFTLTGPPGIGKTQLALEYAHRFAAQYDLIWLIQSDSRQAVLACLADLARGTMPSAPHRGDAPLAALRGLMASLPDERWLLLYDGADNLKDLEGLLPDPGHGHVLVTARAAPVDPSAHGTVRPFAPAEAEARLTELIPGLLPDHAGRLATGLGGVPLTLDLAAAWVGVVIQHLLDADVSPGTVTINAVTELLEQLAQASQRTAAASERPSGPPELIISLLNELLRRDRRGAAASYLLETCACLSPLGLSQRLLRSPAMLAQLEAVDAEMRDPVVLYNVLRALTTHGFSLLGDSPSAPLRVHPLVLDVVRDQMSAEQLAERTAEVARILAANAPPDVDENTTLHADVYAELQQHIEPSQAWRQTEPAIRRWLLNQVRFLWQTETVSAWDTAAELGKRLTQQWAATAQDGEDDPLLLRLRAQLANIFRSRGDFNRACEADADILAHQRRVLGLRHPRTLMTARGYAADLRLVGDFERALLVDQSTWQAFAQTLGDDHALTVIASSNLSVSELLVGEPEQALQRQRADLVRAERAAKESPGGFAWIRYHTGCFLRELGSFEESRDDLEQARQGFQNMVDSGQLPSAALMMLRTLASQAATHRRLGQPSLATIQQVLEQCRDSYGEQHPDTLAISLNCAGAMYAEARYEEAVKQARRTLAGYESIFGEHPFTSICQVSLGSYALGAGDLDLGGKMSRDGHAALETALGPRHLWTLAAAVGCASALTVTGRPAEAQELEVQVLAEYRRRMGAQHPFTRAVETNRAHTLLVLNEPASATPSEMDIRHRRIIEIDVPAT